MMQTSSFAIDLSRGRLSDNWAICKHSRNWLPGRLTVLTFLLLHLLLLVCVAEDRSIQPKHLVPALVVLGDSTVDVGVNNYLFTIIKCNWSPYGRDFVYGNLTKEATGRFCNGKLISDFLTERFGLPYAFAHGDPQAKGINILHGINTGSSGTGWYDGTATLFNVAGMTQQIEWVKEWQHDLLDVEGLEAAAKRVKDSVYIISTGSNDWVNNYNSNIDLQSRYSKTEFRQVLLDNVAQYVTSLHRLGARKIAIVSLPPLGCLPSQITLHGNGNRICVQWMQDDSKAFNVGLGAVIASLSKSLPKATLVLLDAFTLITDAFNNPAKYGLIEDDKGCCGTGLYETGIFCTPLTKTCEDASKYLFWDSYHPTEFFNRQAAALFWDVMKGPFGLDIPRQIGTEDEIVHERDDL